MKIITKKSNDVSITGRLAVFKATIGKSSAKKCTSLIYRIVGIFIFYNIIRLKKIKKSFTNNFIFTIIDLSIA